MSDRASRIEITVNSFLTKEWHRLRDLCLTQYSQLQDWTPEQYEAIKYLVDKNHLFNPVADDLEPPVLLLNMNDMFAWACADGEEITPQEAIEVADAVKQIGSYGDLLWTCKKRGGEPQNAITRRPEYQEAKAKFEAIYNPSPTEPRE